MSMITAQMETAGASVSAGIEDGQISISLALPNDAGFIAADLTAEEAVELADKLRSLAAQTSS